MVQEEPLSKLAGPELAGPEHLQFTPWPCHVPRAQLHARHRHAARWVLRAGEVGAGENTVDEMGVQNRRKEETERKVWRLSPFVIMNPLIARDASTVGNSQRGGTQHLW